MLETLRWKSKYLEMIDQRVLPARFEYVSFYSAEEVANGIRAMVVRGAPAIGCAAAYGVALEAQKYRNLEQREFIRAMEEGSLILSKSRPTAVNLFWALKRMRGVWEKHIRNTSQEIADALLSEAHQILTEDIKNNRKMGDFGASLLCDGARVLTYCNAGALATAGHGTALGVIRSAVESGKKISVIAAETRPFLQGARLTAWEMSEEKIPITLMTDNMIGHYMNQGEVDAVIVGADRVAANGDVVNKIGTYMVAVLAKRHQIPFYIACPLSTIDFSTNAGEDILIEERSPDELASLNEYRGLSKDVKIRNFAFDVTPYSLISALITEKGIVHNPSLEKIGLLQLH